MLRKEFLTTIFTDPEKSSVAFSPSRIIYNHLQTNYPELNFTLKELQDFERTEVYENQIIRRNIRKIPRGGLRTIAYGLDDLWQMDLVDLHDGHFVLARIDVTSKQGDLIWIGDKSGKKVLQGIKKLEERNGGNLPLRIQTDHGKEFLNWQVKNYLKEKKVTLFTSEGDKKAAVVESFNRTWLNKYHKYTKQKKFRRKQNLLDLVVKNYNLLPHSALQNQTPASITLDKAAEIVSQQLDERERLRRKYRLRDRDRDRDRDKRLRVGDHVRIARERAPFYKAYRGNYTPEIFEIVKIYQRVTTPEIDCFKLRDLAGEEIKGVFYKRQLLRVKLPSKPVVEKILKRDKKKKKLLILLRDYPESSRRKIVSFAEANENYLLP